MLSGGRFCCAHLGSSIGTHRTTGVVRLLHFPVEAVPSSVLAMPDQADVGVSGALHTGFGFFGHPNAAPAAPPCGWGGHDPRGPERQRFHVLHSIREELGPLCTPAVLGFASGER